RSLLRASRVPAAETTSRPGPPHPGPAPGDSAAEYRLADGPDPHDSTTESTRPGAVPPPPARNGISRGWHLTAARVVDQRGDQGGRRRRRTLAARKIRTR